MNKKSIVTALALVLPAAGAFAQTLDVSHSQVVPLTPADMQRQPAQKVVAAISPVMGQAVAHVNPDGSLSIRCDIVPSPWATEHTGHADQPVREHKEIEQ